MDSTTINVLSVLFLATFIRSAFGFGEALVSVPLLAFLMPVKEAAPLAVLLSMTIAAVVVAQDWRDVQFHSARSLFVSTLFGIPAGLWLLAAANERVVKTILAVVIMGFSAYTLLCRRPSEQKSDRRAWIFGAVAGVLGGAYGMNGPPLVIYGSLRRWSPQRFRATLQGYFLPASIVGMLGYWYMGLWTAAVTHYYLISLLPVMAAILLGRAANQRMTGARFLLYLHIGLIITGTALLAGALAK